jgi:hypothetical protein
MNTRYILDHGHPDHSDATYIVQDTQTGVRYAVDRDGNGL